MCSAEISAFSSAIMILRNEIKTQIGRKYFHIYSSVISCCFGFKRNKFLASKTMMSSKDVLGYDDLSTIYILYEVTTE